jgi:hypothetical protein
MKVRKLNNLYLKAIKDVRLSITKRFEKSSKIKSGSFLIRGEDASVAINHLQNLLENEIKCVASQFNHFGLLLALHHIIPPVPILPTHTHFIGDSQEKFILAIMAAMKYAGGPNSKYTFSAKEYLSKPQNALSFSMRPETISMVLKFEELINIFFEEQKQYRLAQKGARVKIDFSKRIPFRAVPSVYLSRAAHEYDDRCINEIKNNFLSQLGGYSPVILERDSKLKIPLVNINWKEIEDFNKAPSLIHWINAIPIYGSLFLLREELQAQFNNEVHLEDIIAFLLCSFRILQEMQEDGEILFGLGYDFTTTERFLNFISECAPSNYCNLLNQAWENFGDTTEPIIILESLDKNWWQKNGKKIFDYLSINENKAKSINLKTLTPSTFLFNLESENVVFFAYNTITNFLINLWRPIKKGGNFLKLKGDDFEVAVNNQLLNLKGTKQIWKTSKRLKGLRSKKETDLDVFIGKDSFAFAISCKAFYLSEKYLEGEGQQYYEKWIDAIKWLREVEEVGKFISIRKNNSPFLPNKYKYIVPIVCTGSPIYVWEEISNLRLPNGTPRICTISELQLFIASLEKHKEKLIKSDYTIKL